MAKAQIDEKAMKVVEDELTKNPDASVDELYDKAKAKSPGIGELSKRQFNARYPLQVKRRRAATSGSRKTARKKSGGRKARKKSPAKSAPRSGGSARTASAGVAADAGREAVRKTLLDFASDLAAAEERKALVRVLAGVDKYVDQVMAATTR